MRYKQQTQTKLDAINNQLLTIVKGLDTHTLSAEVDGVNSLIELEPNDYQ